ncbi:golgin subfamily B member 1 [Ixodes scapularis]
MEELEQKDLMIQQLKDIVRANEQILQQKEKELQETTAKFQKLKLQSKAKITQLTHQVKAHESSPGTDAGGEASSGPSSPAQSEAADRGRLRMLKHQLDEAKQRLEKSERDAQARHRALEATVEQLQAQLLQRDQALAEVRPATSQAELPHQNSSPGAAWTPPHLGAELSRTLLSGCGGESIQEPAALPREDSGGRRRRRDFRPSTFGSSFRPAPLADYPAKPFPSQDAA